jgi:transcriptional regulator with XRE-family HTH domain
VPTDPLPARVLARRQAIGDHIRAARNERKLTQETINRIEQGTHATSIDHLILIADALDTPLTDLVR